MSPFTEAFYLSEAEKLSLKESIQSLQPPVDPQAIPSAKTALQSLLSEFAAAHPGNNQATGAWSLSLIHELITLLPNLPKSPDTSIVSLFSQLMNIPITEDSAIYSTVLAVIPPASVQPLTPQAYLYLLQLCLILTDLESDKAQPFLEELAAVPDQAGGQTLFRLLVLYLQALRLQNQREYLASQHIWVELVYQAWGSQDREVIVAFLLQWLISLSWVRPTLRRKEILLQLEHCHPPEANLNQANLLFEIFNIHDKTLSLQDKLNYLNKLLALPAALLTVEQLHDLYYFAGNYKSAMDSSFSESVLDYQYSNYYTYKCWERIRRTNHFLRRHLTPEIYISVQAKVEVKIIELINRMNIQSNVFVETLQANFQKIEELYHQVEQLSLTDSLTGLHNRRYLLNNISELISISQRHNAPLSVAMLDIDHFKPLNDQFGHLLGDYVLTELAKILKDYFRKSDFIIRYGGEEFLILLFDSDALETELLMDGLRRTVEAHDFICHRQILRLTISIGYACYYLSSEQADVSLEQMISEADSALYEAKNKGRNCLCSHIVNP